MSHGPVGADSAPAAARAQQRVEELCAASIRALSGLPDLHFRARRLHQGNRLLPLFGPHLQPSLEDDDFASFRGAADGIALRLALSDAALHRSLIPADAQQRWVFELLEQIRVEALAPADMPGLLHNLRHRFEAWSMAFYNSGLTDTVRGMLLYTVAQVCRSRVTATPVLEATEDFIESSRMRLAPRIGHALAGLRRERFDQVAYAPHALAIAAELLLLMQEAEPPGEGDASAAEQDQAEQSARQRGFTLLVDFDGELETGTSQVQVGESRVFSDADGGYRVFTTAYDREDRAASLVRPAQLLEYREHLDKRIAAQAVNLGRLARQLKALLAQPVRDGWDDDQEVGRIDGRRLARLVSSPSERRLFRVEHQEPVADAVLAFLIDCSGSMRQHIEAVATLVDLMVRALEQAGVATEVLGFTTGTWNGGRARRDWQRAGRPRHPGRLNEAQHLVFKSADQGWRRARRDLAALLKSDLFREGIDGEAVDWACQRLADRDEPRRLLVVISDGCPMDGATALANDAQYLDRHLREVVARRSAPGGTEIYGLGVGLDLSACYDHCTALDLSQALDSAMFDELVQMLAGRRRR